MPKQKGNLLVIFVNFYLGIVPDSFGQMQQIYREAAHEFGYEAGPEHFGYMLPIHVQDTDEKAYEAGRGFLEALAGVGRIPMPGSIPSRRATAARRCAHPSPLPPCRRRPGPPGSTTPSAPAPSPTKPIKA